MSVDHCGNVESGNFQLRAGVSGCPHIEGEIVCARIKLAKSDPLYVLAFYRPPDDTVDSLKCLESVLEELSKLSQKHPKSTIILGGDFNARDIDWDRLKPSDECQKKGMCQNLINILGDAHLHQMQREDTREDAILELFCTNKFDIRLF